MKLADRRPALGIAGVLHVPVYLHAPALIPAHGITQAVERTSKCDFVAPFGEAPPLDSHTKSALRSFCPGATLEPGINPPPPRSLLVLSAGHRREVTHSPKRCRIPHGAINGGSDGCGRVLTLRPQDGQEPLAKTNPWLELEHPPEVFEVVVQPEQDNLTETVSSEFNQGGGA